ncbi:MAG: YihA family ribosome biogenesis GTP-binding protein [Thiotrichaceae bacterium]|nr:YihA family ribosome biogenesis GTP-binding protein [Thiotrichaceae bacterium]
MNNPYHQAKFIQSAANMGGLPPELGLEVAFAGRSNAGKSSVLNRLCQQKSLARTSKTPGRTQLINFFALPEGRYLVDLPGYGYAKVPEKVRRQWQSFIDTYLEERWTLKGVVLLMDIRHPLKNYDQMMLDWAEQKNLSVHVLLNKSDKLKRGPAQSTLLKVRKELKHYTAPRSVQTFSALNGDGFDQLRSVLDTWLYTDESASKDSIPRSKENKNEK